MGFSIELIPNFHGEARLRGQIRESGKLAVKKAAHDTASAAKDIVHVVEGTLQNSITVFRPSEARDRTEEARGHDLGNEDPEPEGSGDSVSLAVGGTTFYAFFEELLHPYMEPALRSIKSDDIVAAARKAF